MRSVRAVKRGGMRAYCRTDGVTAGVGFCAGGKNKTAGAEDGHGAIEARLEFSEAVDEK